MYLAEDKTPINPNDWSGKTSDKWYIGTNGRLTKNKPGYGA